MNKKEEAEIVALTEGVCNELLHNGCSIVQKRYPAEEYFGPKHILRTCVVFCKDNEDHYVILSRSVYDNNTKKEFGYMVHMECTLTGDQVPPLTSLSEGDNITIQKKSADGVTVRLSRDEAGIIECETIYSKDTEIASASKVIATRIIEYIDKGFLK